MTLIGDVFIVGAFVILGAAYFYVIWDCARKNFKEIVIVIKNQDKIILKMLQLMIKWAQVHGFDTQEIDTLLEEYEQNCERLKNYKL